MKTQLMKGASFMTAILLLSMVFSPVLAAPPLPFTRLGDTTYNTTGISSWIDGVEYGNCTSSATGYIELDTVGDDTVPDTVKTGGVAADVIQYSVGKLTGTTARFFAPAENDVWSVGGTFTGDLTADAADTILLKISIVASQSTVTGLPDYIVIYNGHTAAVDASTYSLAVGTAAAQAIVATVGSDIPTGLITNNVNPIPAAGSLVIDMTKWGGLSNTGNSIKLISTTNTRVVDRVEYGGSMTQPENTIMSNAANPASGQEIYRTPAAGTDTNMCAVDFASRAQSVVRDLTAPTSQCTVAGAYWRNTSPITIDATASDTGGGSVASVQLYFRYSADNVTFNAWAATGAPDTTSPYSFSFAFASGQGYYQFYTRATDTASNVEAAPAAADVGYGYDTTAPASQCTVAGAYWRNTSPITIDATATDALSGVTSVQLYFRYSADNVTFNAWAAIGAPDTTSPYSFSFAFASGQGYYEFYTRATDRATNVEAAPAAADVRYGYDTGGPASQCTVAGAFWRNTSPITIDATASSTLSPVASVQLYFRYSADNVTFNAWAATGAPDTTSPYSFSFAFASGQGYYQFYTRATDGAGNVEAAPASADVGYGYDTTAPASQCTVAGAYVRTTSPITIDATASDALSGVTSVQLYFRYSADNVTFNAWAATGAPDTTSPYSFSFAFASGAGYYEFYTRATDRATNLEAAPASADVRYRYQPDTPTATATGPTGTGGSGITLTYTWTLTPTSVNIYYTTSTASPYTWVLCGNDAPVDGSYAWTVPAPGTYWWIASAVGGGSTENSPPLNTEAPEAGSYTYSEGTIPPQVNNLNATHYGLGSTGILLQWTAQAGATSYVVYRTTSLNATWGWAQIAEVATLYYNDTTAYSDNNNYTWVVHSKNVNGENMTKVNSLAYKCCYALAYSTTINGGATNWISLPYVLNMTSLTGTKNDARALRDDISRFSGVTCSVVAWWDPTVGTRSWAGVGVPFALVPGRAFGVTVSGPATYKMVGAYTPVSYALAYSATINGGGSNRISLPYNMDLVSLTFTKNDARALRDNVTAHSGATCSVVAWWDPTVGTRSWAGVGVPFALLPGRGYFVTINQAGTWTCPVKLPGP